jgi:hypothetical protein
MKLKFVKRFWSYVSKSNRCWNWVGGCDNDGYGSFWTGKKQVRAYRVSWRLAFGPIPQGQQVLHDCDNRKCVRPDHLFLGDNAANMADKVAKGRQAKGENNGCSKLTATEVARARELSASGQSGRSIDLGVNESTIRRALSGVTWGDV